MPDRVVSLPASWVSRDGSAILHDAHPNHREMVALAPAAFDPLLDAFIGPSIRRLCWSRWWRRTVDIVLMDHVMAGASLAIVKTMMQRWIAVTPLLANRGGTTKAVGVRIEDPARDPVNGSVDVVFHRSDAFDAARILSDEIRPFPQTRVAATTNYPTTVSKEFRRCSGWLRRQVAADPSRPLHRR
jgi:hypothetical protein